MWFCQRSRGRVVKAADLKSVGSSLAGSNPADYDWKLLEKHKIVFSVVVFSVRSFITTARVPLYNIYIVEYDKSMALSYKRESGELNCQVWVLHFNRLTIRFKRFFLFQYGNSYQKQCVNSCFRSLHGPYDDLWIRSIRVRFLRTKNKISSYEICRITADR